VLFGLNHFIQSAPAQTVRVRGNLFTPVTFVYRTIWPTWYPVRIIPSRPIRTAPVPGNPGGTVPAPQPIGTSITFSGVISSLSSPPSPPPPPTPVLPADPLPRLPQLPPPSP
jgi:hypothetical protein